MTDAEKKTLEQKAEEYAQNIKYNFNNPLTQIIKVAQAYKDGYKAGMKATDDYYQPMLDELSNSYEFRLKTLDAKYEKQKEINKDLVDEMEDLKNQIEKMKNCGNCIFHNMDEHNCYFEQFGETPDKSNCSRWSCKK